MRNTTHSAWTVACLSLGLAFGQGCGGSSSAEENPPGNNNVSPGTDGGDLLDANAPASDAYSDVSFEGCVAVSQVAENTRQPADIVFSIDNTQSMRDEIEWTRTNLNKFSKTIADQGLDPHIVMLSCLAGDGTCLHSKDFGICVDGPLGALGACPASLNDNNPPNYLHLSKRIPSTKALQLIDANYDLWKGSLRANAVTHLVVISDDGDDWTAQQFMDSMSTKGIKAFKFHSIYSYMTKEAACAISKTDPCCQFGAPASPGVNYTSYKDLVTTTGGIGANLCEQNFDPVFQQWANAVIASAMLSCEWVIPAPPKGESLNPSLVNVEFISGDGTSSLYGRVDGVQDCSKVENAWYYDNPTNPTKVVACPQTCASIQGQAGAQIKIQFGCASQVAQPK